MLARNRAPEMLAEQMRATVTDDPVTADARQVSHFYFTAVPTRGWPDMFSQYSTDRQARMRLMQRCNALINEYKAEQRPVQPAFSSMTNSRRTLLTGWITTWPARPTEGAGRTIGVDDDGPVRRRPGQLLHPGQGRHLPVAGSQPRRGEPRLPGELLTLRVVPVSVPVPVAVAVAVAGGG
jgi:hypothetical protein